MKRKISTLVQCDEITRLRKVNAIFVSRYAQAMANGAIFPPVIIERKSHRIVSGNHRYLATLQAFGEDATIECDERTFPDEAALIECAVAENLKHGLPIDGFTRSKIVLRLTELGRTEKQISALFGISIKRVESIGEQVVYVRGSGKTSHMAPFKGGLEHLRGTTVTHAAYKEHDQADLGIPAVRLIKQLIRWIDNGWINQADKNALELLRELRGKIETI